MRLMGLAMVMAIALVSTAVPALAQTDRAAEQAAERAQYVVLNAERALYQAQNAKQDANRTAVQAEEERAEEKGTNAVAHETTAVTTPESGGIPMGNVVLLALGSALLIGGWLIAYMNNRTRRYCRRFPRIIRRS